MPGRRYISIDNNTGAPLGENTSLTGNEYVPISGSQVTKISTIARYAVPIDSDSSHFLDGTGIFSPVRDLHISFTNITTNNADSDHHGYLAKISGDSNTWLNGKQEYTTPLGNTIALFNHYADVGNVTTGEDDLYSDTIAAGQLASNGDKLQIEYAGIFVSSGTATREIKIKFAGTNIFDSGALTLSLSSAWDIYVTIIRVSSTVIRYAVSMTTEGAALAAYTATGELTGLTLSGTNILKITGEAAGVGAATNDIVAKLGSVIYIKAA